MVAAARTSDADTCTNQTTIQRSIDTIGPFAADKPR